MEGTGFRIRTNRPFERVALGLFLACAVIVPVFLYTGSQSGFSGRALAYAKEVQEASGVLEMSSISLSAPVSEVALSGRELSVPNYIVGKYQTNENKVLLMGHSSTVFADLDKVEVGDKFSYNGQSYLVVSKEIKAKSEISMREILEDEGVPILTLMTCAGENLSGQDYSHRLIVDAVMSGV